MKKRVIFDNGGGITVQLGDWAHYYDDPRRAAEDVNKYRAEGNTDGWDGHEQEALETDPTLKEIYNGGYRVWNLSELIYNLRWRWKWNNSTAFFDALNG